MKVIVILLGVILITQGLPTKPEVGIELLNVLTSAKSAADTLESFPWIKASKAKARFGVVTTTPTPVAEISPNAPLPSERTSPVQQPILNDEILQGYLLGLAQRIQQLQSPPTTPAPVVLAALPTAFPFPASPRLLKGKVPKQIKAQDGLPPTTESYWNMERKEYPDSMYDEFYLDWLRKRQVDDVQGAFPGPQELPENEGSMSATPSPPSSSNYPPPPSVYPMPPPPPPGYPAVPLAMNPYLFPLAGLKLSKAMAQAQVNAALAAWNITTTPKPTKLKLKLNIPGGADLAQVVASGIAGFPAGTTYELSKK